MRVYTKDIAGFSVLHYASQGYTPVLLEHVQVIHQMKARKKAEELALKRKCEVKTVDLPKHPWRADVLVKP